MGKRVAIINSVCGVGSTGRLSTELASFLANNGFKAKIYFGRNPNNYISDDSFCFSNPLDIAVHGIYARIFDKSGFGSKGTTKKLVKMLQEYNPDLVLLNNLHGYYLNIEILFKWLKESNKPVVLVCHDCWNFTGHCAYFDYIKCSKWQTVCSSCPAKHSYPKSILFDNSRNNYYRKKKIFGEINHLTVISPSAWLGQLVKQSYLGNRQVVVINNGIDVSKFTNKPSQFREKHGLENQKIILCVAYVFDQRKGIQDIIKLSEIVEKDTNIVIVGNIPKK